MTFVISKAGPYLPIGDDGVALPPARLKWLALNDLPLVWENEGQYAVLGRETLKNAWAIWSDRMKMNGTVMAAPSAPAELRWDQAVVIDLQVLKVLGVTLTPLP